MAPQEIDNLTDVIDSRDVIARIDYLEADRESLDADEIEELASLRRLEEQGEGAAADWTYGSALMIRDSYFVDYAQELADDIGAVPREYCWPTSCIDWEQAAQELRMDYTPVDFDGVTYWVR